MNELPTPETLADLICEATQNMWGVPLTLVGEASTAGSGTSPASHSRMVLLEVSGAPTLSIVVASDEAGGTALGGVMFACPRDEVSTPMIDDSLCELANILAGQLKTLMAPAHVLGLPTVLDPKQFLHQRASSRARLQIGEQDASVCVTVAAA